jgi:dephospho-CoA kinase
MWSLALAHERILLIVFIALLRASTCWTLSILHESFPLWLQRSRSHKMTATLDDQEGLPDFRVLGVCGGIGSGKSSACKLLVAELNCFAHLDSDSIAHTVYEPGSAAIQQIAAEFGSDLVLANGELDRKTLGSIVFNTDDTDSNGLDTNTAMQRLEQIVWPHLQVQIESAIEKAKRQWDKSSEKLPIIIVEAAVLLDAGWQDFLDGVWVVSVSESVALTRLQDSRGLTAAEAGKRITAQKPRRGIGNLAEEVDSKVVTAVIENNGSLDALKQQLSEKLVDPQAWYER